LKVTYFYLDPVSSLDPSSSYLSIPISSIGSVILGNSILDS
jgi:hypothetical protein